MRNWKELFFRRSNQVWAVDFRAEADGPQDKPHLLFDQPGYVPGIPLCSIDVSPHGSRFLMAKPKERKLLQLVAENILVWNWFEELNRKVSSGKK